MDPRIREIIIGSVSGGLAAVEGRLPPLAGVYAWFRGIDAPRAEAVDAPAYMRAIAQRAAHQYGVRRTGFLGPSLDVSVIPRTSPEVKLPLLEAACGDVEFRRWLTSTLGSVAQFLPPLYVGKAINLRSRISTHLKPGSDLRMRLEQAGVPLQEVVIRYILLPERNMPEGLEREIEALLSYYLTPGFTIRYG